jgi:asparaginyl-tRNA synthetase
MAEVIKTKSLTKNQLKKQTKREDAQRKKEERVLQREATALLEEKKKIERSKSIVLIKPTEEHKLVEIHSVDSHVGNSVRIKGWVHFIRRQGSMVFIELRDGSSQFLQCLLIGDMAKCYQGWTLTRESTVELYGVIHEDDRSKSGYELKVNYWKVVSKADPELESMFQEGSGPQVMLDNRHLALRGSRQMDIFRVRSIITHCFRTYFMNNGFVGVDPPTIVQTQCEGGSTLFNLDYYGEKAYMTQSSQLYLETMVAMFKRVFCIMPSYRAEKSKTRRHLSEYTHVEGELGFIDFEDLLTFIEKMFKEVTQMIMDKCGDTILKLNPNFKVPADIVRMTHREAIDLCNEKKITKEDGSMFGYGDDITEAPEREMVELIGKPVMLTKFPTHIKSFYMKRDPKDDTLTESVDLLVPGVGEMLGGSCRMDDYDELMKAYEIEGVDPKDYYWYTDQRKYGSCPHGGFGLGLERYICWILGQHHIREVSLYPRYVGRATP